MRYVILLAVLAIFSVWWIKGQPTVAPTTPRPTPTETAGEAQVYPTVTFNNREFAYALARASGSRLSLIPNFPDNQSFSAIVKENGCTAAINGGFYREDRTPLGWFVVGGEEIVPPRPSALFNGYLVIDGTTRIYQEPSSQATYALQSGPMLIWNSELLAIAIKNDELARRSVVATNSQGEVILLSVFSPDQVFEGPYLIDLPDVVALINQKEKLGIRAAMNLDGGSASAFHKEETNLGELTYVGSVVCAK
jgi:uncharacterized protein YigE (DUF2233 family)